MRQTNEIIRQIRGMQRELYEKYPVSRIGIFGSFSQGHQTQKKVISILLSNLNALLA